MQQNNFLLYGANGYTGELIARYASQYGLTPILAGRSESALKTLSQKLNLPYKRIDLDDEAALTSALMEVKLVIHAAGPFQYTALQMIKACLKTGRHYLDINGDIAVFEMLKKFDEAAKQANIMIMPGVGFDVVPTDCIAVWLKKQLPDAHSLKLAFASSGGGLSHGTATTMAGKLGEGGAIRLDGKIARVPLGQHPMWVDFPVAIDKTKRIFTMSIPWGDISTAHFSTGIPNIETFTGVPPKAFSLLKFQGLFNWILRTNWMRGYLKRKIDAKPAGPSDEQRNKAIGYVWGQVSNAAGKTVSAGLTGPEGYTLTLHSSLIIAKKIIEGNWQPGYQTPGMVYGERLVSEVPGVKLFF